MTRIISDIATGTYRKGRWEYPARLVEDGVEYNTKRDGSGEWVVGDYANFTRGEVLEADTTEAASDEAAAVLADQKATGKKVAAAAAPRVRRSKADVEKPMCLCDCGAQTKGGRFIPGHDAKLKGRILGAARNGDAKTARALAKVGGWNLTKDGDVFKVVVAA